MLTVFAIRFSAGVKLHLLLRNLVEVAIAERKTLHHSLIKLRRWLGT